ncbi:MAG: hypothetical protein ABIU29_05820, partial [Chthoniobacterales bacterium]
CVTITTTAPNGSLTQPIIPVAYLNNYIPPTVGNTGTICTNYLGDPGGSPNTVNSFSVNVPAMETLLVVVEEANAAQTPGAPYTVEVSGLVGNGVGPGPCDGGGGGEIKLSATFRHKHDNRLVALSWTPADGGTMDILRDGVVIRTVEDDGSAQDHLGTGRREVHVYQVCETDTGDCSNELKLKVPGSGGQ